MHHFPFHIADIDHATARLSLEEFGGLVRLWMAYLKGEKPLPKELGELQFLTGARTKNETRSLQQVVKRFFTDSTEPERLQSGFCEAIITDYRASGVQSRYANLCRHWEKANKGIPKPTFEKFAVNPDSWFETDTGRVRKVTGRNPLVLTSESEDSPNLPPPPSQPITNNQEPITIGTPVVPKGTDPTALPNLKKLAEAIYGIYPKKVGKTAALKAIEKVLKSGSITELELQARVRAYAQAVATWEEQDKTFIPHPSTWFNQGRYEDDPSTWTRKPADDAKKKRGGAPVAAELSLEPLTMGTDREPEGWREVWDDLYAFAPPKNWRSMPESNRRDVLDALRKKEGAGAVTAVPPDWREHWSEIFGGDCPDTWAAVPIASQRRIWADLEKKKGGAAEA